MRERGIETTCRFEDKDWQINLYSSTLDVIHPSMRNFCLDVGYLFDVQELSYF